MVDDVEHSELGQPPRSAPPAITLEHGRPWTVVLPSVYRYEDEQFVDEFFDTGRLRLSSFAQFAKYEDDQRGDPHEGQAILRGVGKGQRVWILGTRGISAAVFCCSTRLDRKLMESFGRNNVFEIWDPPAFGAEVARQLVGFRAGMSGHCIYREEALIDRAFEFDLEKHKHPDGTFDMHTLFNAQTQIGGFEQLLLKNIRYQEQAEYRLMWDLDRLEADYVFVEAPLARNFCRRLPGYGSTHRETSGTPQAR